MCVHSKKKYDSVKEIFLYLNSQWTMSPGK
jgi:hypothetical protein